MEIEKNRKSRIFGKSRSNNRYGKRKTRTRTNKYN